MARRSQQPIEMSSDTGTPCDYSEELYRFYLEVIDPNAVVKGMLAEFIGSANFHSISDRAHGYAFDMPIQAAPELIRTLSHANIAVYQLVRLALQERRNDPTPDD
jgi:hypothetical protein